nr:MAG TPA: hypothetical protein [Caudoviricetes sp.]
MADLYPFTFFHLLPTSSLSSKRTDMRIINSRAHRNRA